MSLTEDSCLIFKASISKLNMNARGEKGHPCLIPPSTAKLSDIHPK